MIKLENLDHKALDRLGISIKSEFDANEALRKPKEEEWLQSLRQIEQVYDPESEAKMSADEPRMYPGYTTSKTEPLKAKLSQHLFSEKEKNWHIKTSPIPSVSQETLDYIVETLTANMKDETGNSTPLTSEIIEGAIKAFTSERCEKMAVVIADQLLEDKYREKQKEQLYAGIDYGTGIIKGALTQEYTSATKVVFNQDTLRWVQGEKKQKRPSAENILIFNFFPDMGSTVLDKCRFVDILYRFPKHNLLDLAKRSDFFGDVIYEFLKTTPKGNYKLRDWETTAQTMGINPQQPVIDSEDYEVVERDCYIDGQKLLELGVIDTPENEDDLKSNFFCNVWLLDKKIIKIATWSKKQCTKLSDIYHLFYYKKNETSIFGKGLPKIVRYAQLGMAACDRNMLTNAGWISGPCGEINIELLHKDFIKDAANIHKGKMYVRLGRGQDSNIPVLRFYQVESHSQEYLAIKNDFRNQGDTDSSLPSYLFGSPSNVPEETAKGMSIKFASMVDFIKSLVGNFDEAHKSYLASVYRWNMAFNDDEGIKGDMDIETIGSAAAIIHQAIVEQWAFLIQSMPDEAKDRIDWDAWLKMIGKNSDIPEYDKIVLSEEKYQEKVTQRQQEQERQLALQEGLAQAKIGKDTQTAKKTEAATAKIISQIPHELEAKTIENIKSKHDVDATAISNEQAKANIEKTQIENAEGGIRIAKELTGEPTNAE